MEYVKSWDEPDYPHGKWINEDEWEDSGIDEIIERASKDYDLELEGLEDGYFAVYSENDLGCQRLIPLEYSDNSFETVRGVFDSNPGVTQRYTPWETAYTEKGLEQDLEAMDGKLVQLTEDDLDVIVENFPPYFEEEVNVNTLINGIAGVFWRE